MACVDATIAVLSAAESGERSLRAEARVLMVASVISRQYFRSNLCLDKLTCHDHRRLRARKTSSLQHPRQTDHRDRIEPEFEKVRIRMNVGFRNVGKAFQRFDDAPFGFGQINTSPLGARESSNIVLSQLVIALL